METLKPEELTPESIHNRARKLNASIENLISVFTKETNIKVTDVKLSTMDLGGCGCSADFLYQINTAFII